MTLRRLHARLDNVHETLAEVEQDVLLDRSLQGVRAMTATREDFDNLRWDLPRDPLDELVARILANPLTTDGTEHIGGPLLSAVFDILATPPGQPVDPELVQRLEAWSDPAFASTESWIGAPCENPWCVANMALSALGPDLAPEVRAITAPTIQAARLADEEAQRQSTEMIRQAVRDGSAGRMFFMVYFDAQEPGQDRMEVRARAIERIEERRTGSPRAATTAFELAAEIASHPRSPRTAPRHDPRTAAAVQRFEEMCDAAAPEGQPGHEEWLDANRWYWGLGGGLGHRLRAEMETEGLYDEPE